LFRFRFYSSHCITVDAWALRSILLSLNLINVIHCTADTKATPASVQSVGVDF